MTALELQNDAWVRRFWRNCPQEYLAHMATQVVPAARRNLASWATDKILLHMQGSALYQVALRSDQLRLHCLTGRVVRIARDFVVERTPGGRPKRARSTGGHHRSYTIQQPRAAGETARSVSGQVG